MRKDALAFAVIAFAVLGGQAELARADEPGPMRGKTYTTDSDVTRVTRSPRDRTQINILRGTEPKEKGEVTLDAPPEAKAKDEAPKTRTFRRGRHVYTVPAE